MKKLTEKEKIINSLKMYQNYFAEANGCTPEQKYKVDDIYNIFNRLITAILSINIEL